MKRTFLAIAAATPFLAACAGLGGADPRAANVATPVAFSATGGAVLSDRALDRWWTLYADPELEGLVEQALRANTDVRLAVARLEEARATRASVLRSLLPNGDLTGGVEARDTRELSDGDGDGQNGGGFQFGQQTGRTDSGNLDFSGSQELDIFGRNRQARRTLDAQLLASRYAYESVRAALAAQTADTLFLARGTAVQLEDARETLRITTELSRVTRIRSERGLSPRSEFDRAETERANAQAEIARLEAALRATQRVLLTLTGRSTEDVAGLPIRAVLADAPAAPETVPTTLLVRRADVREAQAQIDAAAGNLKRARLALLPTFTLRPGVGLSRTSSDLFSATNGFWALGVGLLVPVLDRPRLLAEVQVNGARAEQAVIGYERAVQTAVSEADQALVQLAGDRERVRQLTEAERRAQAALDAAQRGYQAGLIDLQALLDAERAYRGTRSALSGARTQALQRSVQAFRALGGGWNSDAPGQDTPPFNQPPSTIAGPPAMEQRAGR